ncbi:hypothetical protein [Halorientalis marina]|jgi:hypothetical protein|uniref:hypothetical protein n=1 Tax=Halorientalis marina TaxID=2931976 RepID=UPI001FF5DC24|nr:hypothetical protein [Halorientalis marina]
MGEFMGLARRQQAALVAVVGFVLTTYGLASSSAVDATYDPLPFGIGIVMVLYAVGVLIHDRFLA